MCVSICIYCITSHGNKQRRAPHFSAVHNLHRWVSPTRHVSGGILFTTSYGRTVDNVRWSKILDKIIDFYRTTRMHSADYAITRCLSICPSVCPSDTPAPVFCQHRLTFPQYIIFSPSGNPTTQSTQTSYGGIQCNFRPIARFISEMMRVRAIVNMEGE